VLLDITLLMGKQLVLSVRPGTSVPTKESQMCKRICSSAMQELSVQ